MSGLSFFYPNSRHGHARPALDGISCCITKGEQVVLTGPSGSGKTTFIRCLNGLIPHAIAGRMDGTVQIYGQDTRKSSIGSVSSQVGMVFQDPDHQMVTNEVDEEIAFGLEHQALSSREIEDRISSISHTVGIDHLRGRETDELSWGERQKVAIASVLVMHPQVLVLDEPLSGLDPKSSAELVGLLNRINRESGVTTIVVEHRLEYLSPVMQRLIVLNSGAIIYDGAPSCNLNEILSRDNAILPDMPTSRGSAGAFFLRCALEESPQNQSRIPAIELRDVTYTYPGSKTPALDGIRLRVYPGEIAAIIGANGSGKSTLTKLCNGLLKPDRGKVCIFGRDAGSKTVAELARQVGLVSQYTDYQIFEDTIADELAFGPRNLGVPEEEIARRRDAVIACLQIDHLGMDTPPLSLSVGEKQRVAIGGLLMMQTPALILDEPTLGLDRGFKVRLAEHLRTMRDHGCAIVVVTHDMEFAPLCADRIVHLMNSRIYVDGYIDQSGMM
jgi:energy-coupling factor transporter ATP-binding protein EcfA2